uniref:Putative zinc finger, BED-type n=1 Tax=Helianthus annuus TaxID=4232 RepID=A0A251VE36_HELAN
MNLEDDEVGSMDVDDKNDSGVRKPKAKRSRKERSVVWHYFTKRQNKALGGKVPSKCNKCGHVLMFDSKQGTGNFTRHISSCYGTTYKRCWSNAFRY